jgi:nucleotide-binding universal stress UspA family protein
MALRTVVIGIDFSDASLGAARWVASHLAPEAKLVLVHVIPGPPMPAYVQSRIPAAGETAIGDAGALTGRLRGVADLLGNGRARVELLSGMPAEGLALIADAVGADLVCVGRAPRSRGSARFGAMMPLRLLTWTRVPTLVVPVGEPGPPSRIVVGVDDRPGGSVLFDAARELATRFRASVDAVHVIEPDLEALVTAVARRRDGAGADDRPVFPNGGSRPADSAWLHDRAREWVSQGMRASGAEAAVTSLVQTGDPGPEIIRHSRLRRGDLIVVGRGGDSSHAGVPVGSLRVGSTTRLVLWAATCPVLVLPLDAACRPVQPPSRTTRERARTLQFHPVRSLREARSTPPFPAARSGGSRSA